MDFNLKRFYDLNRKAIIWLILFGLIYILSDFFTLIFLTFIVGFFAYPLIRFLREKLRMSQGFATVLVHVTILIGYLSLYFLAWPSVSSQLQTMREKLPSMKANLNQARADFAEKYPDLAAMAGFDVVSSLLNDDDIVDWKLFYLELSRGINSTVPAPARNVIDSLPDDIVRTIARTAEVIRHEDQTLRGSPAADAAPPTAEDLAGFDRNEPRDTAVLNAINQRVIQRASFYRSRDFLSLKLRDETRQLREAVVESDPGTRPMISDREVQKFNRLLIEDAFPTVIAKRQYVAEEKVAAWIDELVTRAQEIAPSLGLRFLLFARDSVLAILFSFLILLDFARLSREIRSLEVSRLRDFYDETAQPVVNFAVSVGRGFQAQVLIAFITTVMMVPLLLLLRLPSLALLLVMTFVTSLLPVVGVLIEGGFIVLVALNEYGLNSVIWASIGIVIIHVIIGYVVTPIVFGRKFKMNLVAILFVLFIGNKFFGAWGMILGVPVANYLLRDVFRIPIIDEREPMTVPQPIKEMIKKGKEAREARVNRAAGDGVKSRAAAKRARRRERKAAER